MTIGEKIIYFRKKNKINKKTLSKITGISVQKLKKYEEDIEIPSKQEIEQICDVFELDYSVFDNDPYVLQINETKKLSDICTKMLASGITKNGKQLLTDIKNNKFDENNIYIELDSSLTTEFMLSLNKIQQYLKELGN